MSRYYPPLLQPVPYSFWTILSMIALPLLNVLLCLACDAVRLTAVFRCESFAVLPPRPPLGIPARCPLLGKKHRRMRLDHRFCEVQPARDLYRGGVNKGGALLRVWANRMTTIRRLQSRARSASSEGVAVAANSLDVEGD